MDSFKQSTSLIVNNLEIQRNKRPLKIPKGLSKSIATHNYGRSLAIWLELKPLFISGVIFSDNGKISYKKIASFTRYCESAIRGHITNLRKLDLITIDKQRNIHLKSYKFFKQLITKSDVKTVKYWKLDNDWLQGMFDLIHSIAIHENLNQQKYYFKIALTKKMTLEHLADLQITRYCKKNTNEQVKQIGFHNAFNDYIITEQANKYIEIVCHRYSKRIDKHFEVYIEKEKEVYKTNYLSKDYFNAPNPFLMLSGEKISEMFGKSSKSTGYYLLKRLEEQGHIEVERETIKTMAAEAEFSASFMHHERPNFVNSSRYARVRKKTSVKNYKYLYKTVVKFPNVLNVTLFS